MAVRRLHPDQPPSFAFSPENLAWAKATIAKYPPGKEASAVLPVLWRAQEQNGGWLTEPAIRNVADMLGMAYIRVLEVATFYTMFQLAPVGKKAHVQVCGTTPCMLRGAEDLIKVCKSKIHHEPHHVSADGDFSWEEVECLGSCANAPMVQIWKDTYEDLTPQLFEKLLEGLAKGNAPKPGSMIGRTASCPEGGPTSLTEPSLYDGSSVGAWKKRFQDAHGAAAAAAAPAGAPAPSAPPPAAAAPAAAAPAPAPAASAPAKSTPPADAKTADAKSPAAAAAGTVLAAVGGGAAGAASAPAGGSGNLARESAANAVALAKGGAAATASAATAQGGSAGAAPRKPELLAAPRGGKGDDLGLIWGVAEKLQEKLNAMGIWHFDQIARWTPEEVAWFEAEMQGFKGRIERDKWIEQCRKLADGWRPDTAAGERPKG